MTVIEVYPSTLPGEPLDILLIVVGGIRGIRHCLRLLFHAGPERFLRGEQPVQIDLLGRGLRPEHEMIRHQISVFAQGIGDIQGGGTLQMGSVRQEILQEGPETDLQQ